MNLPLSTRRSMLISMTPGLALAPFLLMLCACAVPAGKLGEPGTLHAAQVVQVLTRSDILASKGIHESLNNSGVSDAAIADGSVVVVRTLCCGPPNTSNPHGALNPQLLPLKEGDVVEFLWPGGIGGEFRHPRAATGCSDQCVLVGSKGRQALAARHVLRVDAERRLGEAGRTYDRLVQARQSSLRLAGGGYAVGMESGPMLRMHASAACAARDAPRAPGTRSRPSPVRSARQQRASFPGFTRAGTRFPETPLLSLRASPVSPGRVGEECYVAVWSGVAEDPA